ncbi:MAG: LacI family DNA-binding transcriptional regulator [Oscillospiraceae bacterium]
MSITIKDVAREAGVSVATVSRVSTATQMFPTRRIRSSTKPLPV